MPRILATLIRLVAVVSLISASQLTIAAVPTPTEGDYVIRNFTFTSGEMITGVPAASASITDRPKFS